MASRAVAAGAEAMLLGPTVAVVASRWGPSLAPNVHWGLWPWEVGSYPWEPLGPSGASGAGLAFEISARGPSGAVSQLPSESALPFPLLQVGALEGAAEQSEGGLVGSPGLVLYPGTQGQQLESWASRVACCWEGWAEAEKGAGAGASVGWWAVGWSAWLEWQELGRAGPAAAPPHQSAACWPSFCGASGPAGAGAAAVAAGAFA